MNQIQKFLNRLTSKERAIMDKTIEKVIALDLDDLDVKKLKGLENMYRVRKGDIRIIFCIENTVANILSIGRRDDNTYNI